jgi:prepilin-type N-terminal cleavage/methylation domain-containing protein
VKNKEKEKGFSLAEMLIVLVVTSIIATMGLISLQSNLESIKLSTARQNFDGVLKHIRLETALFNGDLIETSKTIRVTDTLFWTKEVDTLDDFLNGVSLYFGSEGYSLSFFNPLKPGEIQQVFSMSDGLESMNSLNNDKGSIIIRINPDFPNDGTKTRGDRRFQVIFYMGENQIDESRIENFNLR